MKLRLLLLLVVVVVLSGCAKRRCEAARVEALPEWQTLQAEVDHRLAQESPDAGSATELDERAQARFELIKYQSQTLHALTATLAAPLDPTFVPSFDHGVREISESVHGLNDPTLNSLLAPARRSAMNVLAACPQ